MRKDDLALVSSIHFLAILTIHSGERCIYHVLGGGFFDKTKPGYATEGEARRDGCRRSRR